MKKSKQVLSLFLSLCIVVSCMVGFSFSVSALDTVSYIDSDGSDKFCSTYTVIDSDNPLTALTEGWYVVDGTVNIDGRITVSGDVKIILKNGCMYMSKGISELTDTTKLTIYAQSKARDTMGGLVADTGVSAAYAGIYVKNELVINGGYIVVKSYSYGAGIGGSDIYGESTNCGTVTINGGEVVVYGGMVAAAIGGGVNGSGGNITINGGKVKAYGGEDAAAIGGGYKGSGGNITITGGEVKAYGGPTAAAIGGGENGSGGNITITGGEVKAYGGENAAAIGGGELGAGGTIKILGGQVTATSRVPSMPALYGIGAGKDGTAGTIELGWTNTTDFIEVSLPYNGAVSFATGKVFNLDGETTRAYYTSAADNNIDSKKIVPATAYTINYNAGGGSGTMTSTQAHIGDTFKFPACAFEAPDEKVFSHWTMTGADGIYDPEATIEIATNNVSEGAITVTAVWKTGGPVKYIDSDGSQKSCSTYTVIDSDNPLTALTAGWYVVDGTVDIDGRITVSGDVKIILKDGCKYNTKGVSELTDTTKLTIYGQSKVSSTAGLLKVVAANDDKNAGIYVKNELVINSGNVSVRVNNTAAAIGGSDINGEKDCGTVTINGGFCAAYNYLNYNYVGAGIGGANGGSGGNITINGGEVNAGGGYYGAGIGGGYGGSGSTITITGGVVNAGGSYYGAGIGGGYGGSGGNITISGGVVDARGGDLAAAIGGGKNGSAGNITISGGVVDAYGGCRGAAAIGGGNNGAGGTIKILGGQVTATSKLADDPALYCIGAGEDGTAGTIELGWTDTTDFIEARLPYNGTVSFTTGKAFVLAETPTTQAYYNSAEDNNIDGSFSHYTKIIPGHAHVWGYSLNTAGDVITASCSGTSFTCGVTTAPTLTLNAPANLTYNGEAKEATLTLNTTWTKTNGLSVDLPISYFSVTTSGATSGGTALVDVPIGVGHYYATVTVGTGTGAKTAVKAFSIAAAEPTITTAPSATGITYGQTLESSTLSGGEASVEGTFAWKDKTTKPLVSDSGTTGFTVVFTPSDTTNYSKVETAVTLTVDKLAITITPSDAEKVYDGTVLKSAGYSITTGALASGDSITSITLPQIGPNVDSKTLAASGAVIKNAANTNMTANYDITYETCDLAIEQLTIVITAASETKEYDGETMENDGYTVETLVDGDYVDSLTVIGSIVCFGTADNEPSDAVIKNANGDVVTDNYNILYVMGVLEVTRATVTVTADDVTKFVGEADPPFTATVTGLFGRDTVLFTFERDNGEEIGEYTINPQGENIQENYIVEYYPGTLTISKVNVTSVVVEPSSISIQPGQSFTLTATVYPANVENKNVVWYSSNDSVAVVNRGVVTGVSAGEAYIYAKSVDDNNFKGVCVVSVAGSSANGNNGRVPDGGFGTSLPTSNVSSTPSAPKPEEQKPAEQKIEKILTKTVTPLNPNVFDNRGKKVTASVIEEAIKTAENGIVTIAVDRKTAAVSKAALQKMKKAGVTVEFNAGDYSIVIDPKNIRTLKALDLGVTFYPKATTVNGRTVSEGSLTFVPDQTGTFGGMITITIAADKVKDLDLSKLRLYRISKDGTVTRIKNAITVNTDGSVSITINRRYTYVLTDKAIK